MSARIKSGKIGIGIVGANFGRGFQFHVHPDCRIVAVCDKNIKVAESAIKDMRLTEYAADTLLVRKSRQSDKTSLSGCSVYGNFIEMLKDKRVDAVAVFTPAPLHAAMSCQALNAGKHVLCAVPAAFCLEDCVKLVETVRRTGLNYMMAETSSYYPHLLTLQKWQRERERMGVIFHSEAEYIHYAPGWAGVATDRTKLKKIEKLCGWRFGFPPGYYMTHSTSGVIAVTGERLTEVTALGWGVEKMAPNRYYNPFSNLTAFFKTSGGHSARIASYWHCAWGPWTTGFDFYGTKMTFLSRPGHECEFGQDILKRIDEHGKETVELFQPEFFFQNLPAELLPPEPGHYHSHPFITHEFIRSIIEQRPPAIDVYEAVAYTAPGLVAQQSAMEGGAWKKIPDFGKRP